MECALFRKDYDMNRNIQSGAVFNDISFMECALFRKDYDVSDDFSSFLLYFTALWNVPCLERITVLPIGCPWRGKMAFSF